MMKIRGRGITNKILIISSLMLIAIVGIILIVVSFTMTALTDSVMLDVMQVTARTAAQSIRGNLGHIEELLYLKRSDRIITSAVATYEDMTLFVELTLERIDFEWVGLYDSFGKLITGSAGTPGDISGREIFSGLTTSNDISIESIGYGTDDLEIVMGLPIHREWLASIFLVGSHRYEVLTDVLQRIRLSENSSAFTINETENIIPHKY